MIGHMELRATESGFALVAVDPNEALAAEDYEAPARTRPNVKAVCKHLASMPGPHGSRHHVMFEPDRRTRERMYAWKRSGNPRGITVEDNAGRYSRDVPMRVVDIVYDYGTMVVTTDC